MDTKTILLSLLCLVPRCDRIYFSKIVIFRRAQTVGDLNHYESDLYPLEFSVAGKLPVRPRNALYLYSSQITYQINLI